MVAQKALNDFATAVRMDFCGPGGAITFSGNELWKYNAGAWQRFSIDDHTHMEHLMWQRNSEQQTPTINFAKDKEDVWRTIKAANTIRGKLKFNSEPMLVLPNGTLFLRTNRLRKHDPAHYATRAVAIEYDSNAECPRWEAALERVFGDLEDAARDKTIAFLQEFFGVSIVRGPEITDNRDLRTGLFVTGPTKTGKTQITEVLTHLLGGYAADKVVAPTMKMLAAHFGWQAILGAQALISQDSINADWKVDAQMLKQLATGEEVIVDIKNRSPVPFSYDGPVLFTANDLPTVVGHDAAVSNRYAVIEMSRQFSTKDRKNHLEGHSNLVRLLLATGEMAGVLNWALAGYDSAVQRGEYDLPSTARSLGDTFRAENDPVFDFLRECCEFDEAVKNPSELIAALACEYAERQHRVNLSRSKAIRQVPRVVRDAWPGVEVDRVSYPGKTMIRSLIGLKLNAKGKSVLAVAVERGVLIARQMEKKHNVAVVRGG